MNQSNKPASINQERSQWINRALILNLLRQEGICSRATLSRLSGLKQATITNIAGELIQCGLVVETGLIAGAKGRRSIGVTLNDARYKVVGIRMTRDQFYVSLVGISGKMYEIGPIALKRRRRRSRSYHAYLPLLDSLIRSIRSRNSWLLAWPCPDRIEKIWTACCL